MKQAMKKWLHRHQITFDPNTANSICNSFGLDGEKADECLGLCYQLEKGNINEADFTGGLSLLTGKKPEEVMGVLKGMGNKEHWQMTLEEYAIEKGARPAWVKAGYGETYRFHKRAVERAIAEGKPVPLEVLVDYPELRNIKSSPTKVGDRVETITGKMGTVINITKADRYGAGIMVRFDDGSEQYYTPVQFDKVFKK